IAEAKRVLRPGGRLIICTVNCAWSDFNPSPFSIRYFSAVELASLLGERGFSVELLGAFPVERSSLRSAVLSAVKRAAVKLGLIPKTMTGKQLLKRIFFGRLAPIPKEVVDGMAPYAAPTPFPDGRAADYTVLYALCESR